MHQLPRAARRFSAALLVLAAVAAPVPAALAQGGDSAAVHAAVLDYVEALYDVAPDRVRRSVSPAMAKYGYLADSTGAYRGMAMTFDQLVALAARYNVSGRVPKGAPKRITVYDVQDQTASAKLVAHWGTDYLLLAKQDGRWVITHVLWQSPPRRTGQR
jgi:hypothetical protein